MATEPFNYESEELATLIAARRYQEWIAEQFRPYIRGTVMEVGAGIGTMAQKWIERVARLHLVEPAENLFPRLQARFGNNPRVTLHRCTLEQLIERSDRISAGSLDAVILINVLEHIEHDEAALRLLWRLLTPGGRLLIFVPAMPSLYGSLDKCFGHYRRYTSAGLGVLCDRAGYLGERLSYFDMMGAMPWWLMNRILRSQRVSPTMTSLYDHCVVPVARWLESYVQFPFGKNLVYVGKKTE